MNGGSKYDLVLMDIIMPNLDGVSACHLIRQFDSTPIIAMTSNIRSDDISMYFAHGEKGGPDEKSVSGLLTSNRDERRLTETVYKRGLVDDAGKTLEPSKGHSRFRKHTSQSDDPRSTSTNFER